MKKVSIVLPTYNGEKYIKRAIESVLFQDYPNWELIVVDDCSTDTTHDIIEAFANEDERISVIRNEMNLKLPQSLNVGFEYASGDYLTWTSDDNLFRTDALSIMVSALDGNPDVDVVYCDVVRIDAQGDMVEGLFFSNSTALIYIYNVIEACFMYRAGLQDELKGYSPNLFLVEDYDFWLRAYRTHKFKRIKDAPYYYRLHDGSLSSTREKEVRKRTYELLKREMLLPNISLSKRINAALGVFYNYIRYLYCQNR